MTSDLTVRLRASRSVLEVVMVEGADRGATDTRRDRRYEIHEPVWYRTRHGKWREATTVNVGVHGALIRAALPAPDLGAAVRLRIPLPANRGWAGSYIASAGRVVRVGPPASSEEIFIAVAIISSQLRSMRRLRSAKRAVPLRVNACRGQPPGSIATRFQPVDRTCKED